MTEKTAPGVVPVQLWGEVLHGHGLLTIRHSGEYQKKE